MGKNIESVKTNMTDFNVIFVDVYEDASALQQFKINVIPTQIIKTVNGTELFRHQGILEKDKITELIKKYNIKI